MINKLINAALVLAIVLIALAIAGLLFIGVWSWVDHERYMAANHCRLASETPTGHLVGVKVYHEEMRYVYKCDFGDYVEVR